MLVVFDIETVGVVPPQSFVDRQIRSLSLGGYGKDVELAILRSGGREGVRGEILERWDVRVAEVVNGSGLDARFGRVVVCCFYSGLDLKTYTAFDGTSEEVLLCDVINELRDTHSTFITFGGRAFDFPFIKTRLLLNGMGDKCSAIDFANERHMDLSYILNWEKSPMKLGKVNLEDLSGIMDVPYKNVFGGGDIQRLYNNGMYSEIESKCQNDVISLYECAIKSKIGEL